MKAPVPLRPWAERRPVFVRRARLLLGAGTLLLAVTGALLWYSISMGRRVWKPRSVPLRLAAGERALARFVPDERSEYQLAIEIRTTIPLRELERSIGGDFFSGTGPPGVRASYEVMQGGRVIVDGVTGPRLYGYTTVGAVGIDLVRFEADPRLEYTVRLSIADAVPALREASASMIVRVSLLSQEGYVILSSWSIVLAVLIAFPCAIAIGVGLHTRRRIAEGDAQA